MAGRVHRCFGAKHVVGDDFEWVVLPLGAARVESGVDRLSVHSLHTGTELEVQVDGVPVYDTWPINDNG